MHYHQLAAREKYQVSQLFLQEVMQGKHGSCGLGIQLDSPCVSDRVQPNNSEPERQPASCGVPAGPQQSDTISVQQGIKDQSSRCSVQFLLNDVP